MILTIRTPLETINKRVANDGKQVAKETMLDEMIGRSRVGELMERQALQIKRTRYLNQIP